MTFDRRRILLLTGGAALAAAVSPARSHEYEKGGLKVEHPWLRAPLEGESKASLFMTIYNKSDKPERLVGVKSPKIGRFELHVAPQFAVVSDAIYLPPGAKVVLAPGGSFIRLLDIEKMNPVGWGCELSLLFESAGELAIEAAVDAPDAAHAHDAEAMERWEKAHARGAGDAPAQGEPPHEHGLPDQENPREAEPGGPAQPQ